MLKEMALKATIGTMKMTDNVIGAMADYVLAYVTVCDYGMKKVREFGKIIKEDLEYDLECLEFDRVCNE